MRMMVFIVLVGLSCGFARSLYPTTAPLRTGRLRVGIHELYYEEHGRCDGVPALFLHGGPGAGCFTRHAGFFDPAHYRVVLFDQRGCGRSTPRGCLEDNDTSHLIDDIEQLRRHLAVSQWMVVLGGSWGVTLALAYAAAHPGRVGALVLRAVCLMREIETRWLFGEAGGARRLQPEQWDEFALHAEHWAARPEADDALQVTSMDGTSGGDCMTGSDGTVSDRALRLYAQMLRSEDVSVRGEAARCWSTWENRVFALCRRVPLEAPPLADATLAAGSFEDEIQTGLRSCQLGG